MKCRMAKKVLFSFILAIMIVVKVEACDVKNVVLMIPDGTSVSHITLARWFADDKKLAMDEIVTGLVKTHWADGTITDSSAAATAFSTGNKTEIGCVGVVPVCDRNSGKSYKKPVATLIEAAKVSGIATGVVCTSNLNDATPACFSSHVEDRLLRDLVSEQQVYSGVDVFLGGGSDWYFSGDRRYNRKDGRDLKDEIVKNGYHFVTSKEEMLLSHSPKLWGSFAPVELPIDDESVPTLQEMTKKSLDILSKNNKGFFLMVEGSKIDWASHYNDTSEVIKEVLAFDDAVREALDFAKLHTDTVVIVCPDHGNGGLSIGNDTLGNLYKRHNLDMLARTLKDIKTCTKRVRKRLKEDMSNLRVVLKEELGIKDLTKDEEEYIKNDTGMNLGTKINRVVSKRMGIAWTTEGHTGEDVFMCCYHPDGNVIHGVHDNLDVNAYIQDIYGFNLSKLTEGMFVLAKDEFVARGYNVEDIEDELIVTGGGNILKLPYNKNVAYLNGKKINLDGINVYTGEYLFIARSTLELMRNLK